MPKLKTRKCDVCNKRYPSDDVYRTELQVEYKDHSFQHIPFYERFMVCRNCMDFKGGKKVFNHSHRLLLDHSRKFK